MKHVVIPLSTKAGNVVNTDTVVPSGKQWRLLFGSIVITTDATVANRYIRPSIMDDVSPRNSLVCLCAGAPVTASSTNFIISLLQGIYRETSFINGVLQSPVPEDAVLDEGWTFGVTVDNGVAGDSYHGYLVFREDDKAGQFGS